jgi:hypothetical protein
MIHFTLIQALSLLACYAALTFGTWLIWPSRWNLIAAAPIGFFFVAYVVPLLLTDELKSFLPGTPLIPASVINAFVGVMALGAACYLAGLYAGHAFPRIRLFRRPLCTLGADSWHSRYVSRATVRTMLLSAVGLYLSFLLMGYVPAFSQDPLQAKYFHGEYRSGYLRAIAVYFPSYSAFISYLPLLVLVIWLRRRLTHVLILLGGAAAFALTLHRGEVGGPLLLGIGLALAASRIRRAPLVFALIGTAAWSVGAILNFVLAFYLNVRVVNIDSLALEQGRREINVGELMAAGAPDVYENLLFFSRFRANPSYTLGRNWIGGLVPLQSEWHPNIWALSVAKELRHQEAANYPSGGIRVALPLTGYSAFDLPGVIFFSFLSGSFTGYVVRFARTSVEESRSPEIKAAAAMIAWTIVGVFGNLTWHSLVPLIVLAPIIHPVRLLFINRSALSLAQPPRAMLSHPAG